MRIVSRVIPLRADELIGGVISLDYGVTDREGNQTKPPDGIIDHTYVVSDRDGDTIYIASHTRHTNRENFLDVTIGKMNKKYDLGYNLYYFQVR